MAPRVMRNRRLVNAMYVRNFVFGAEDSLVSTVGLLSGVAAAGVERTTVILTGVVLIFVEALSMAVGSFLSENSAEEYLEKKDAPTRTATAAAVIMFGSYFILGFIPLLPYVVLDPDTAFSVSIILSLGTLFALGVASGREFRVNAWRSGLKMLVLGGLAIAIGIIVGRAVGR